MFLEVSEGTFGVFVVLLVAKSAVFVESLWFRCGQLGAFAASGR